MATYDAQRADAGLLITEGTAPMPDAAGYARTPGLYNQEHVSAWSAVTQAVHARGGKIFVQLMHTGRVSHPLNMPAGSRVLAPSPVPLSDKMWSDAKGMQPYPQPLAMTEEDIRNAIQGFADTAQRAVEAGFDGVEVHGANGYLVDQFLNTASNQRTDRWGGSVENRMRFALEVTRAVVARIGAHRTGLRISPFGVFNGMRPDDEMTALYEALATEAQRAELAYLHVLDHSAQGAPEVPASVKRALRGAFTGPLIMAGGFDRASAEAILADRMADLVAFGRPFLANPDLVRRLREEHPLNPPQMSSFYTPGEKGYTDYPVLA